MTFITLLVSLEESLDGIVDLSYLFLEQGDQDLRVNPFRDVGSLTDLILQSAGFGEQEQSSD